MVGATAPAAIASKAMNSISMRRMYPRSERRLTAWLVLGRWRLALAMRFVVGPWPLVVGLIHTLHFIGCEFYTWPKPALRLASVPSAEGQRPTTKGQGSTTNDGSPATPVSTEYSAGCCSAHLRLRPTPA